MEMIGSIKKVRKFAFLSFLIPLLAINACLLLYSILGSISTYYNWEWDNEEIQYSFEYRENLSKNNDFTYTNCPKYTFTYDYITFDNQIITTDFPSIQLRIASSNDDVNVKLNKENLEKNKRIANLMFNGELKSVILRKGPDLNKKCVKNHRLLYAIISNFNFIESILISASQNNSSGFSKIKNPYFYGEVSISRTARYFPATLIFKPFIILSALFLFLYWRNNLILFNKLKNQSSVTNFSKKFYYFGLLSCVFLALHAALLGLEFDSKLFTKFRRLVIILFIFFEIVAQIFLTVNLLKFRKEIKNYINSFALKAKVAFVTIAFFSTSIIFYLLATKDVDTNIKHVLEWNYFSALLLFYFISFIMWKKKKT